MIRNLTPHPINLYPNDDPGASDLRLVHFGPERTFMPDGPPVRLAMIDLGTQHDADVPYELVEYGHAHDLPPKQDGVRLIVSLPVALSLRGRDDLLVPYLEVRDETGAIAGCRMLAQPV